MPLFHNPILVKKQGLTPTELTEIHQLAAICNSYEQLTLKLNWEMLVAREHDQTNDFLYYADVALIGCLSLFSFTATEVEISGMVHPDYRRSGIFTALYEAAKAECQRRGFSKILLIVESTSAAGLACARSLGAQYSFSEYVMVLAELHMPTRWEDHLRLRAATPADRAHLIDIEVQAFGRPLHEVKRYPPERLAQADHGLYVGELDGVVIGKIDVDVASAYIHGFGVLPAYQGHGYGRQILAATIQVMFAKGLQDITLEVAVTNKNALSLYQSCGFSTTSCYDYHLLVI